MVVMKRSIIVTLDGDIDAFDHGNLAAELAAHALDIMENANVAGVKAESLALAEHDVENLKAGLDALLYWELSDPAQRNSGYVLDPLTPEQQAVSDLLDHWENVT